MTIIDGAIESKPTNLRSAVAGILADSAQPVEAPETEENLQPEGAVEEETETVEEEEVEGEAAADGEEGEEAEDQEGEEEAGGDAEIRNLKDLAAAIDVDAEFLYNLEMPLSGGGDPVKLGDIKDKMQEASHILSQKGKLDQERAALAQEQQAWKQQAQQAMAFPREIVEMQAQLVSLQKASEYLDTHRDAYEAGELALKRQEIQQALGETQTKLGTVAQQLDQQRAQANQQKMLQEAGKLLELFPEWKDQAKAQEGQARITATMTEYGFSKEDLGNISDHRILKLLHDFSIMRSGVKQAEQVISKRRKVPKVLKAGGGAKGLRSKKKELKADKVMRAAAKEKNLRRKGAFIGNLLSGA